MTCSFTIKNPKQSPKYVPALILVIFGVVFWCGLICGLPQWFNNQRLQKFAHNLYSYPLPPKTEIISQSAEVGLMGNGNHCDFVVTQSLTSILSRKEIEVYYQDVVLPAVDNDSIYGDKVPLGVYFDDLGSVNGQQKFTLKLIDAGYPPGLDIRCH